VKYDRLIASRIFGSLLASTGDRGSTVVKVLCYRSLVRSQPVPVDISLT